MKKSLLLLLLTSFSSLSSFASFTTLSTEQTQEYIKQGIAIIDVRRVEEYEKLGIIQGSHKLTFFDKNGNYNAKKWLEGLTKIVKNKDDKFILVCARANRTKTIGKFLNEKTEYKNVYELGGGITGGWIYKGLATTKISVGSGKKPWYKFW